MPVIATNTSANTALRYLNLNSAEQSDALNRLASGSRINKASDDAAGLAVATKLKSDVSVLGQAQTNASHASSVLQTADGGASQISDILERMKELVAQSLSGAVTDDERAYIDAEFSELIEEIDSIASGTRFNGESLLDGTGTHAAGVDYLVGTDASSDILTVTIDALDSTTLGVAALSVDSQTNATAAATAIDTAIDSVASARADLGAQMSRFEYHSNQLASAEENLSAAQSAIIDADVAEEQTRLSSAEVKTNAAIAALASANNMPQSLLQLLQ